MDTAEAHPVTPDSPVDQQVLAAMAADGVPTSTPTQADYFGFSEVHTVTLPDGVSYVQHRTLTEGDRRLYLNTVNREVRVQKVTGDAIMKMAAGDERYALLQAAIVGWNLTRDGKPVVFSKGSPGAALEQFLDKADPKLVDMIEKDVRKVNAWLAADVTVGDIDKQMDELRELRDKKIKEAEGNAS